MYMYIYSYLKRALAQRGIAAAIAFSTVASSRLVGSSKRSMYIESVVALQCSTRRVL